MQNGFALDYLVCRNYICDPNTEQFDNYMEDYYQWKMENDTSYYRSDEDEPWFNCSDWSDRVAAKIESVNLVETSTSYSGKYMMDYLGITLLGTNLIDSDTFHVIKNKIRELYNYKINLNLIIYVINI
jgi:hypothetical protein